MRPWKGAAKVALGALAVVVLAGAVVGVIVLASVWHTVAHGDEETRRKVAAEVLSCAPEDVKISGSRAEGCGRACILQTSGSSATWWSSYACVPEVTGAPGATTSSPRP